MSLEPDKEIDKDGDDSDLGMTSLGLCGGLGALGLGLTLANTLATQGLEVGGGKGLTIGGAATADAEARKAEAEAAASTAQVDFADRVKGAILGAAAGAVAGSFFAGLGAIPGAVAGAAAGFALKPDLE